MVTELPPGWWGPPSPPAGWRGARPPPSPPTEAQRVRNEETRLLDEWLYGVAKVKEEKEEEDPYGFETAQLAINQKKAKEAEDVQQAKQPNCPPPPHLMKKLEKETEPIARVRKWQCEVCRHVHFGFRVECQLCHAEPPPEVKRQQSKRAAELEAGPIVRRAR